MNRYERQCRSMLSAFPADFRAQHGDELVTTLVDEAGGTARNLRPRDALNLVAAGLRMRAARSGAGKGLRANLASGIDVAAITGLGLQAALSVATAAYFAEHGVVFYLLGNGADMRSADLGGQYLATWAALALLCCGAFVASVRGRRRAAAGLVLVPTVYVLILAVTLFVADHGVRTCMTSASHPTCTGVLPMYRYSNLVATPALVGVGVLAACCALLSARHGRNARAPLKRQSWWWVAAAGALALVFVLVGDGTGATGVFPSLTWSQPPQYGVMDAFACLWAGAVVIGVPWSLFDPRTGWTVAVLSLPCVTYQVSAITIGRFYFGEQFQPWWRTDLPLMATCAAIVVLVAGATTTGRRLRRI